MPGEPPQGTQQSTTSDANLWRLYLIVCAIVLLVVSCMIYFAIQSYRETARRDACRQNLKQIGLALHAYEGLHGSFPPAYTVDADGRRLHSWPVLLLPQLGEEELYSQYNFGEPWDSPHNRELIARMPPVYACPEQSDSSTGVTRYVAVVGKETIWPEQYAAQIKDVTDGTSNTILVLEWSGSDIAWTEPRDVQYRDTEKTLDPPAHSGSDAGIQHILLGDGDVRGMSVEVDRETYRKLQTRSSGAPLAGVDWPVDPKVREFDFGDAVPAGELAVTDILPHRGAPIVAGRNTVWCATFQIAWDDLRVMVGEPVSLDGGSPLAVALNQESFDRAGLDPESYVARGGRMSDGILDDIQREMSARFPNSTSSLLTPRPSDEAVVIYCYLLKILPFAVNFERLTEPLQFRGNSSVASVTAFGLTEETREPLDETELRKQVTVLDYTGPDDFVLQLDTLDGRDVIMLAKVAPAATLAETIDGVRERIKSPVLPVTQRSFEPKETLAVPVLNLNVDRRYDEIIGRNFLNTSAVGLYVDRASQIIRFHLDERGAHLESEVEILGENGHFEPPPPPQPRKFIFDRPFLLMLQERDASQPYFAAWIGNAELMETK